MKTLLIDDIRDIKADRIARDFTDGLIALRYEGPWDLVLLDHDLANFGPNGKEYTGYDILCWLEENPKYLPKKIILVTANPVGRQRMQQVLNKLYVV